MDLFKIMESMQPWNDGLPVIPDYLPQPNYQIGEILNGRYEIKALLHGSQGDVYYCFDQKRKQDVAIKTIIGKEKTCGRHLRSFIKEVQRRIDLKPHPNVLAFDRILEIDGYDCIVSEWISPHPKYGNTLTSWIRTHRYEQEELLNALIQICYGLQHCYDQIPGFVFEDLKPDNILVNADGICKLSDFSGGYTAKWASPEQQRHQKADRRSDVYAFGVLAGEIQNVTCVDREDLDDEIYELLTRCQESSPENRPESIHVVLEQLLKICSDHQIMPYKPEDIPLSFRDNFNRYTADHQIDGTAKKAVSPDAYHAMSFITGKGVIRLEEYAEYVSSEDKAITEARKLESDGKIKEALDKLSDSVQSIKKSNRIYIERARLYTMMGNIHDAIRNCDAAILNGDDLTAYDLKANLLLDYPQISGDRPEIPILTERLEALPKERYVGYLANQVRAKYYMLSGRYPYASSYFRRSLQYPNKDEWLTLYYYGCCEECQKHTDNQNILFRAVCEDIESDDYLSSPEKCTKLLFSYWKLKNKHQGEPLIRHLRDTYHVDYSGLFDSIK